MLPVFTRSMKMVDVASNLQIIRDKIAAASAKRASVKYILFLICSCLELLLALLIVWFCKSVCKVIVLSVSCESCDKIK